MSRSVSFQVRIRVEGHLSTSWWSGVFSELAIASEPEGTTLLSGELADQAALHGLLAAIRDLGLSLISVQTVASQASKDIEVTK